MTADKALYQFFNGIMPSYPDTAVADDVVLPYLTYSFVRGNFRAQPVSISVNMWFLTDSEAEPNAAVERLSQAIGMGGKILECDEGKLWLKRGEPWATAILEETANNRSLKRRFINITIEYLTE